jgi:hypothetical protein
MIAENMSGEAARNRRYLPQARCCGLNLLFLLIKRRFVHETRT